MKTTTKALKAMMVPRFYGKNPQPQGEEPMLNDQGLMAGTKSRIANPNPILLDVIDALRQEGMVFEAVGTGLKIGRMDDGRKNSVCVMHNVNENGFGLYILKAPPVSLPDRSGIVTDGEPIKGANSHSSRLTVPFDGNSSEKITNFIKQLPHVFESGRKTTFNDGRVRKEKKAKAEGPKKGKKSKVDAGTTEIAPKAKAKDNEPKANEPNAKDDNVVHFTIGKKKDDSLDDALETLNGARRKKGKNTATA
jgi:hypothetical protein